MEDIVILNFNSGYNKGVVNLIKCNLAVLSSSIQQPLNGSSIANENTAGFHRYHIRHLSVCHLSACYPTNIQTELKNNNQDDAHTAKCSMPSMLVLLYSRIERISRGHGHFQPFAQKADRLSRVCPLLNALK